MYYLYLHNIATRKYGGNININLFIKSEDNNGGILISYEKQGFGKSYLVKKWSAVKKRDTDFEKLECGEKVRHGF